MIAAYDQTTGRIHAYLNSQESADMFSTDSITVAFQEIPDVNLRQLGGSGWINLNTKEFEIRKD